MKYRIKALEVFKKTQYFVLFLGNILIYKKGADIEYYIHIIVHTVIKKT